MRGLACLLMFQTHCYDSWLRSDQRGTAFFQWSQLGGTLPAPLFIFLAGVSVALVTGRLREKGIARNAIARQTILRGAEVFGYGILFRIQEFLLGFRGAPWTDLLRVDVLNILGLSMILMGVFCWFTAAATPGLARRRSVLGALVTSALIAMATPPLWTTWRPRFLPWFLESYINGVHTFNEPQHWLFPVFPWAAFAFAGLAVGFLIFSEFARRRETLFFALLGLAGVLASALSVLFDSSSIRLYTVYDYWHSNPDFLLMRCGVLLVILSLVYAWCRWGFAENGFSPLIQLGNTSLLVYWVHIEFVYGSLTIMPKRACSIPRATLGLTIVFLSMLALSLLRTRWRRFSEKKKSAPAMPERPVPANS